MTSTLLLVIYKIEDGKGSEDGCGYELAKRAIKQGYRVTIITRPNNIALLEHDEAFRQARLLAVDVPKSVGWFKRGERGIILYYYLWQWWVGKYVEKLLLSESFDVIHLLNFHTDWCPHFLKNPNGKLIWGPIVHHGNTPYSVVKHEGVKATIKEYLRRIVKLYFWYVDPFMRPAIAHTDIILYGNKNIAPPFASSKAKVDIFPYAGSIFTQVLHKQWDIPFTILFVGRFVSLKNPLAVAQAFTRWKKQYASNATCHMIGRGPLQATLQRLATECSDLFIHDHMPQTKLQTHYQHAHLFCFPSYESQGLVVSEALSGGAAILALKSHGPAFVAGNAAITLCAKNHEAIVNELVKEFSRLYAEFINIAHGDNTYITYSDASLSRYRHSLSWDEVFARINQHYRVNK